MNAQERACEVWEAFCNSSTEDIIAALATALRDFKGEGYREGYLDGQADTNAFHSPPNVAQPWTVDAWRLTFHAEFPTVLFPARDPRLKTMTPEQLAQLGRALKR